MSEPVRILALSGSARKDSLNSRVLAIAVQAAEDAGGRVTTVDWEQFVFPLYSADLEAAEGLPSAVKAFRKLMLDSDGLLLACPEYNSSITPLLKNAIDWASRAEPGEGSLAAYKNKVAGLLSASPGALGGLRGLVHVRAILSNIGVLVLPNQFAVSSAHEAFDTDGRLKNPKQQAGVERVGRQLVETIAKLKD